MFKLNKKITGTIKCMDSQYIEYSVSYTCEISHSIFNFNINKNIESIKSFIEYNIHKKISENKMKYFLKEIEDNEFFKERDKWIDTNRTVESQRIIRDTIIGNIFEELDKYNYTLIKFDWMPIQLCHSLEAAIG